MNQLKTKLVGIYESYKHLLILLYFVVYLIWFGYVEKINTTHFHVVHLKVDDYIPFCEYFVIPYILWFAYVAWGVTYTAFHNKKEFFKLCVFLYTGMTVFLIISTIYPNGQYLRPYYFSHHNICTTLCEWIYSTDTPTNLFPSIHVYNSLGIHFMVVKNDDFKEKKVIKLISGILCTSIVLATMLIKQHSAFDVITAFLLGFIMFKVVYMKEYSKTTAKSTHKISIKSFKEIIK